MPSFAVEVYTQKLSESDLLDLVSRLQQAAEELSLDGAVVRHVEAFFVPEDEVCLHLFQGPSAESIGEVMERAGLLFERVMDARTPESPRLEGGRS